MYFNYDCWIMIDSTFLLYAGLFKLKIEVDVFLHQDVDRHIFYGCDRLFEYHVIAQCFDAAIALQSRPLPDEIVHFADFSGVPHSSEAGRSRPVHPASDSFFCK